MTNEEFKKCLYLKSEMFKYPGNLNSQIVFNLDKFISSVGSLPVILSDYRPGDTRQHGVGNAIDSTWPNNDPLSIWNKAIASRLFSGLGIYVNEQNIVSFHFDVRPDRDPSSPAIWGDIITYVYDPDLNDHLRKDEYTTAEIVIDFIKKKSSNLVGIIAILLGLYLLVKR